MRQLNLRFQLVVISLLLFATFALLFVLVAKNNRRWDLTQEKLYSLSEKTIALLRALDGPIEVLAFYPQDDPRRTNFESFLKEAQAHHPDFKYFFHDPDRVPALAKQYQVQDFFTVVLRYKGRVERIVGPTEEAFANALLRLANPKRFQLCFIKGHGEPELSSSGRSGLGILRGALENIHYEIRELILTTEEIPGSCDVAVLAGPQRELDPVELRLLASGFEAGRGILFLIDPTAPGAGQSFKEFVHGFGIALGDDVVVDKMTRLVGGDHLIPLVNQYVEDHPITARFEQPTFFPVVRSVQPLSEPAAGVTVVPLSLTGSGSWAETNLETLEKGDAAFEPALSDLAGPISIAVAAEKKDESHLRRMVVIGDSDFITNGYILLAGNQNFAFSVLQWLTKDDRFVSIPAREPSFQPLFVNMRRRTALLLICVVGLPLVCLAAGSVRMLLRARS